MTLCRSPLDHHYWNAFTAEPSRVRLPVERRARITFRLPRSLKGGVEASAALEGLSVDAWVTRALARSIDPRARA